MQNSNQLTYSYYLTISISSSFVPDLNLSLNSFTYCGAYTEFSLLRNSRSSWNFVRKNLSSPTIHNNVSPKVVPSSSPSEAAYIFSKHFFSVFSQSFNASYNSPSKSDHSFYHFDLSCNARSMMSIITFLIFAI